MYDDSVSCTCHNRREHWLRLVITGLVLVQNLHKIPICVTIGSLYHYHLSRHFPHFSDGRRSNTRKASLVTSRDQVARLAKTTTPYLGHLYVRSRSRRGKEENKVIGSPVQDNKQSKAYNRQLPSYIAH
jgi:hypothetical protein